MLEYNPEDKWTTSQVVPTIYNHQQQSFGHFVKSCLFPFYLTPAQEEEEEGREGGVGGREGGVSKECLHVQAQGFHGDDRFRYSVVTMHPKQKIAKPKVWFPSAYDLLHRTKQIVAHRIP